MARSYHELTGGAREEIDVNSQEEQTVPPKDRFLIAFDVSALIIDFVVVSVSIVHV